MEAALIRIRKIAATNWVTYPTFELKLDSAIVVIRGLNLDAQDSQGLNRVGKSLIPAVIPRLLYGSAPQPIKSTKRGKQAFRAGTILSLDLQRDANHYRVQGYFERTARLRIIESKGNRGIRLKKDAEEALQQVFPHNDEQFYATVYIDGRRPATLQYGTDTQRFSFFEQVFNLGIYRVLSDDLKPHLQTTTRAATERNLLQEQLDALVSTHDVEALKNKLRVRQSRLDAQKRSVEGYRAQKRRVELYVTAIEKVPDDVADDAEDLRAQMDTLSKQIDAGIEAEERNRLYAQTEQQRIDIQEALQDPDIRGLKIDPELPKQITALEREAYAAREQQAVYDEITTQIEDLNATIAALNVGDKLKATAIAVLQTEQQKAESRIGFIGRLTQVLSGSLEHEKTCPVCAGKFDAEQHAEFDQRMQRALAAAQKRKALCQAGLDWHTQQQVLAELNAQLIAPDQNPIELDTLIRNKKTLLRRMQSKVDLLRRLKALPTIEKTEFTVDLSDLRAQNRALLERLQIVQRIDEARRILASLNLDLTKQQAKRRLENMIAQLPAHETHLSDLEIECADLRVQIQDGLKTMAQRSDLQRNIATLDRQLADQPILDALKFAFGFRGLVKQRTQDIAKSFEVALNDYAGFVFDEPITFRLDVTETRFGILATRNGIEDDVRSLSGQESRAFSLITLLSLLRFLPTHLRCDTVVLDELEANMDAASRNLFANKLIPELLRFVDHVIVVTAQSRSEFYIPDSEEYYAVKSDGQSRLVAFADLEHVQYTSARRTSVTPRKRKTESSYDR